MEQKLRQLIKESMIEKKNTGKTNRYQTYKNILEKAQKATKEKQAEITDTDIYDAVKKEMKQLEDLLSYCQEGTERYTETRDCLKIAKALLPKMATKEEMLQFLQENKTEKNIGICMKVLTQKFGASLDKKLASETAKKYITE